MDEHAVKATISGLIAKLQTLQTENADLRVKNAACAQAMSRLVTKVEHLQAQLQEHRPSPSIDEDYRRRPAVMRGRTVMSSVGCGPLYITLNEDESGKPFEVFFKLGKSGSCQQSYLEALGVAISVGLRYGADPQKFIEKFEGMRCPNPKMRDADGPATLSCADGISQGLARALELAFPITDVNPRAEAHVVSVAEPLVPLSSEERSETQANAKSIDLISTIGTDRANGNGNGNGDVLPSLATMTTLPSQSMRKKMLAGVGMCPKCGGNLISQGGCIQCLHDCGYIGKCS
jgi:ribonucleoside-diphosphate reductase alpha chain